MMTRTGESCPPRWPLCTIPAATASLAKLTVSPGGEYFVAMLLHTIMYIE